MLVRIYQGKPKQHSNSHRVYFLWEVISPFWDFSWATGTLLSFLNPEQAESSDSRVSMAAPNLLLFSRIELRGNWVVVFLGQQVLSSFAICLEMLSFRFPATDINYLNFKFGKPTFPASHSTSSLQSLPASVPACRCPSLRLFAQLIFSFSNVWHLLHLWKSYTFPKTQHKCCLLPGWRRSLLCSIKSCPSPHAWPVQHYCTFIFPSRLINYFSVFPTRVTSRKARICRLPPVLL